MTCEVLKVQRSTALTLLVAFSELSNFCKLVAKDVGQVDNVLPALNCHSTVVCSKIKYSTMLPHAEHRNVVSWQLISTSNTNYVLAAKQYVPPLGPCPEWAGTNHSLMSHDVFS